jgi:hypothetical protein
MRNKTFVFSGLESAWLRNNKSDNWESLKERFSGRLLFTYNCFNLLKGDMSVLQNHRNRWLLDNIINYTASKKDQNFIPVLKKIADDSSVEESLRQRSAEILEMPWVEKNSFAGTRTPQTSEILKLLKSNSVESKRLAIYMIGKFKLTDMIQDVADCLRIPGLEIDTSAVLLSFKSDVGVEMQQLYLKSSGNINTSRAVLHILCNTGIKENIIFVFERLWSNSKEIKEAALECLVDSSFKVPEESKARIIKLICEVTRTLLWIISAQTFLKKAGADFLVKPFIKEIIYWKRFLFGLLTITYESGRVDSTGNETSDVDPDICKSLPELLEIIYGDPKETLLGIFPRPLSDEQRSDRLYQFLPAGMTDYDSVIEDLINSDYNQISLWTRACILRSLKEIKNENLIQSVTALLFSPEEILQEEAAKLIARSGIEKYSSVSLRIPALTKIRLDKIINSETQEMELLFEKTDFLSSLFPEIPEDKLLFLSKEMKYIKNPGEEYVFDTGGVILWAYRSDPTKPDIVKVIFEDRQGFDTIKLFHDSHVYLLPLKTVEEYHYLFPEHSFAILKYIDDHEKSES